MYNFEVSELNHSLGEIQAHESWEENVGSATSG
jgi:hypothetical protein